MFDHVTIRVSDREASERFYDTVLATLGIGRLSRDDALAEWEKDFSVAVPDNEPIAPDAGIRLGDDTPERVQFRRARGAPGERAVCHDGYYAAFALDPDGHNIEVVDHNR